MWSIYETIEADKILVTACPGIWIIGHILCWPPPGQQVDRSLLTVPGPDWIPHMCRVLKENIGKIFIEQIYNDTYQFLVLITKSRSVIVFESLSH